MKKNWVKISVILATCIFLCIIVYMAFTYDEVPGADEKIGAVTEEYAAKVGVKEREPFINTDKGDILLFLFCFGGLAAGFYLGYKWRDITTTKPDFDKLLRDEEINQEKEIKIK